MNVIERERILTDAARRYLRGQITYDELTVIRRTLDDSRRAAAPGASEGDGSRYDPV